MTMLWVLAIGAALGAGALVNAVLSDMAKEEVTTRLNQVPVVLIRIATVRVPADLRDDLAAEWRAELDHIIISASGLPLTRLLRGTLFALGVLRAAKNIARELEPVGHDLRETAGDEGRAAALAREARLRLVAEIAKADPAGVRTLAFWPGAVVVAALAALDVVPLSWTAQAFGLAIAGTWLITGILLVASLGAMICFELTKANPRKRLALIIVVALAYAGLVEVRVRFLTTVAGESLPAALMQAGLLTATSVALVLCGSAAMARTQHYRIARAKAKAWRGLRVAENSLVSQAAKIEEHERPGDLAYPVFGPYIRVHRRVDRAFYFLAFATLSCLCAVIISPTAPVDATAATIWSVAVTVSTLWLRSAWRRAGNRKI
jgi:hypothetical protein